MDWPLLDEWQNQGVLSPLDLYYARRTAHHVGEVSEEQAAILAATMALARQGHLCLSRKAIRDLFPASVQSILEKAFLTEESEWRKLMHYLHRKEECFYLPKNWALEQSLLFHLQRLSSQRVAGAFPSFELQKLLNQEQYNAVQTVWQHRVSLVTGGPGTGKTFTAAAIAQAFTNLEKIILAAPTARAADHLKKKMISCGVDPHILQNCGTLHKLLRYKVESATAEVPWLDADLVIVDECSMIDAPLFIALLAALPKTCTLVLMGDPNQLHPVGIGSLFSDLVVAPLPLPIGRAHLHQCLRVEDRPLLELAKALLKNEECEWPLLNWVMDPVQPHLFYKKLWGYIEPFWPRPSANFPSRETLMQLLHKFRILSVLRQGPFGTESINEKLVHNLFELAEFGDHYIVPIQVLRNDATTGLCNGELGILVQKKVTAASLHVAKSGYAFFASHEEPFAVGILPQYEYAFCSSVHKSQGSEYEEVLLIVPPGSETFGKEMLYTGVTRAKKTLLVVSTAEILACMQKNHLRKQSGITL